MSLPHAPLHGTALMVIDMQRDFCEAGGYADRAGLDIARLRAPIANITRLLAAAREYGVAVLYTREGHRPDLADLTATKRERSAAAGAPVGSRGPLGRLLVRGEYGQDVIDELAPRAGEPVIDKPGYSAFHATGLARLLDDAGIRHLILTGITTDVCVHSTLRAAVDRGYRCITVGDACAASDTALHDAAIAMIGGEGGIFGGVASTESLLQAWKKIAAPGAPA
ncbi:cysteine hydrolase family protein [Acidihalobacter prosperus]|uniref:Cysteine hydrolase n=1 Tax=Acidihalobacter prosperus TaxID=160660 RepID=A0A1A6C3W7_9GAMM|nr:isochorismatase family cysteine hydrolase [Acidihalobacter prosperus]OBS09253.1 cysteine hydrolase [Acidihalobacter prosperus]